MIWVFVRVDKMVKITREYFVFHVNNKLHACDLSIGHANRANAEHGMGKGAKQMSAHLVSQI